MHVPSYVALQGIILGLTYGLLAMGLVLIYKSNRVLNFAHGQLGVLSAVLLHKLTADVHTPYWPTLGAVLVLAMLLGALCELMLRRLFSHPRLLVMVATIGISELLLVLSIWKVFKPRHPANTFPVPFHLTAHIGPAVFGPADFATLLIAPAVALGLALFFSVTPYGLAVRAAAENAESARLGGIWVRRTSTLAWTLAGLLSGITAVLVGPTKPALDFGEAVGPGLLVRGLAAALLGGMVDLRLAFAAGIGVGVIEQIVAFNHQPWVEPTMFGLVLAALVMRVRTLRLTTRTEERSSWRATAAAHVARSADRRLVGLLATLAAVALVAALPARLNNAQVYLVSRMFVFGMVAVSLTVISGWAGQLSLGHFGLVAVGSLVAVRWGPHMPMVLTLVVAGLAAAVAAVLIGVPALRMRGLYLAVTTLAFAVLMSGWVVRERHVGLPDPSSTRVLVPPLFGMHLGPRGLYYVALAVLALVVAGCHNLRNSGVGRCLLAVRENEVAAGALGVRVVITKLTAFAVSGFVAGVAGVFFAYNQGRLGSTSFDPSLSILVVAMIVIGGMASLRGGLLAVLYLLGLPAMFGLASSSTVQTAVEFMTGGIGLLVFIMYLPTGLAGLCDRLGDLLAVWLARARRSLAGRPAGPAVAEAGAVMAKATR